MARRRADYLTGYLCWFCGERIEWGVIVRVLRRDPGQPEYEQRENYAHLGCLEAKVGERVRLEFSVKGLAGLAGPECGLCGRGIEEGRTNLRLQRPTGTIKRPTFDEQALAVHLKCWERASPMSGAGTDAED